jgi:hypothetical protein
MKTADLCRKHGISEPTFYKMVRLVVSYDKMAVAAGRPDSDSTPAMSHVPGQVAYASQAPPMSARKALALRSRW